ncbi:FAD-binding oxidoreductase [Naasia sp. SYSU D00948]|uniref:NAD(P)/FAD-dependent oxidoreductase n=1 Tax=Naasia sp. SYSU D00948 TaxID=2817379 RepID=UPI0027DB803C|nr:FAD-binding oxidoreductase [Naasia sp. SYSU D00948]
MSRAGAGTRAVPEPAPSARRYRDVSFWMDELAASGDDPLVPRPPLDGDLSVDVCIVGGGLTGLWTAHYLLSSHSRLRIAVLEKEIAGFGASGRNGGWCSALFPRGTASLERTHGRSAALALRRALRDTVDEVGRVTAELGIECGYARGGTISYIRSRAQRAAAERDLAEARRFGVDELELLGPESVGAARATGAVYDPACARVQPARLVRGLAASLESRGVTIYEQTPALELLPRQVRTPTGTVSAGTVVVALEGYTPTLAPYRRRLLPLYSLMIATEPLPESTWRELGISHGQTFTDYRHLLIYGQRTQDDRIAFGGRGARYHFGSRVRDDYDRVDRVFGHLRRALTDLFPATADVEVTHRWGGPLGVPRDWHPTVWHDPRRGLAFAGGYVGDGLSLTNLAGRTLAELITGSGTGLSTLPWVGHRSPRWEPEPLRFLGANAGLAAMTAADLEERVRRRPSLAARLMGPLIGG